MQNILKEIGNKQIISLDELDLERGYLKIQDCRCTIMIKSTKETKSPLDLEISDCCELKTINLSNKNIKSLRIVNCPNLSLLSLSDSKIESLEVDNCPGLEWLNPSNNKLGENLRTLTSLENLKKLDLSSIGYLIPLIAIDLRDKFKSDLEEFEGLLPDSYGKCLVADESDKLSEKYGKLLLCHGSFTISECLKEASDLISGMTIVSEYLSSRRGVEKLREIVARLEDLLQIEISGKVFPNKRYESLKRKINFLECTAHKL